MYQVDINQDIKNKLKTIWSLDDNTEILDITPFGDLFIQISPEEIHLISATDGQIVNVTDDVLEFGLPPVELALGDEWYQLGTQSILKEEGYHLEANMCFGFKKALFLGGEYSIENVEVFDISQYHQAVFEDKKSLPQKR